jgi:hypothetical protein
MNKTTISLTVGIALALFAARFVHARGFGGVHAGSGSSAGATHESGAYARSPQGAGAVHHGSSEEVYRGPEGTTVAHSSTETRGATTGPGGTAAGGKEVSGKEVSGTAVRGPQGNEYTHESSAGRGAATGSEGADAGRYASSSSTYHAADGATSAHATAGYSAEHTALPTDAGYGATAAKTQTAAYAGHHQTEAVSGSVAAARGASVRTAYSAPGLYGKSWYAANPGAWAPAGWTAGRAWSTATWPAVGASLGWGSVQPAAYNYGTNVTYQGNEVYYGDQPAATAEEYYQQASAVAESAPATSVSADEWLPLGVFALVQKEQSDPHFVMDLAVNKSGAVAGNYSDLVSGTTVPIQGAVDKKTQRVAWTVGKNKTTVCETGLYNLTQDEAPALIHMGKDKTQQWLLVRMKQPAQ